MGSRTKNAIQQHNDKFKSINFSYTKRDPKGEPCVEPHCSEYMQMELYRRSGVDKSPEEFLKLSGITGDA